MQILFDALLAFLCCVGLWTLGQMALGWLLGDLERPAPEETEQSTKEAEAWMKQESTTK